MWNKPKFGADSNGEIIVTIEKGGGSSGLPCTIETMNSIEYYRRQTVHAHKRKMNSFVGSHNRNYNNSLNKQWEKL